MALQLKQLPSFFRFITERFSISSPTVAKITLSCLLSLLLLYALINQSLSLKNNLKDLNKTTQERKNIQKEIAYWKNISGEHKAYADIYLKIASLEYQLGNAEKFNTSIKKAFILDPDTEQGRVLGEHIGR